jgi:hypothetical protein
MVSAPLFAAYLSPILDSDQAAPSVAGFLWNAGGEYFYGYRFMGMDGNRITEQKYYDATTGTESVYPLDYYQRDWWVLLKLGYQFAGRFSAGAVIPFYGPTIHQVTEVKSVVQDNFTFTNPWLWGRGDFGIAEGSNLGIRLGVKLPLGGFT